MKKKKEYAKPIIKVISLKSQAKLMQSSLPDSMEVIIVD